MEVDSKEIVAQLINADLEIDLPETLTTDFVYRPVINVQLD